MKIRCNGCSSKLAIKSKSLLGKTLKCPKCGAKVRVPDQMPSDNRHTRTTSKPPAKRASSLPDVRKEVKQPNKFIVPVVAALICSAIVGVVAFYVTSPKLEEAKSTPDKSEATKPNETTTTPTTEKTPPATAPTMPSPLLDFHYRMAELDARETYGFEIDLTTDGNTQTIKGMNQLVNVGGFSKIRIGNNVLLANMVTNGIGIPGQKIIVPFANGNYGLNKDEPEFVVRVRGKDYPAIVVRKDVIDHYVVLKYNGPDFNAPKIGKFDEASGAVNAVQVGNDGKLTANRGFNASGSYLTRPSESSQGWDHGVIFQNWGTIAGLLTIRNQIIPITKIADDFENENVFQFPARLPSLNLDAVATDISQNLVPVIIKREWDRQPQLVDMTTRYERPGVVTTGPLSWIIKNGSNKHQVTKDGFVGFQRSFNLPAFLGSDRALGLIQLQSQITEWKGEREVILELNNNEVSGFLSTQYGKPSGEPPLALRKVEFIVESFNEQNSIATIRKKVEQHPLNQQGEKVEMSSLPIAFELSTEEVIQFDITSKRLVKADLEGTLIYFADGKNGSIALKMTTKRLNENTELLSSTYSTLSDIDLEGFVQKVNGDDMEERFEALALLKDVKPEANEVISKTLASDFYNLFKDEPPKYRGLIHQLAQLWILDHHFPEMLESFRGVEKWDPLVQTLVCFLNSRPNAGKKQTEDILKLLATRPQSPFVARLISFRYPEQAEEFYLEHIKNSQAVGPTELAVFRELGTRTCVAVLKSKMKSQRSRAAADLIQETVAAIEARLSN